MSLQDSLKLGRVIKKENREREDLLKNKLQNERIYLNKYLKACFIGSQGEQIYSFQSKTPFQNEDKNLKVYRIYNIKQSKELRHTVIFLTHFCPKDSSTFS